MDDLEERNLWCEWNQTNGSESLCIETNAFLSGQLLYLLHYDDRTDDLKYDAHE